MDIKLEKGAVQICRICLQDVGPDYPILYLSCADSQNSSVTIQDKLIECVPELNLSAVPNATICNECSLLLSSAYSFKLKCLRTEMQIKKYLQQINSMTLFDLAEVRHMDVVNKSIKNEEVVLPFLKMEVDDGCFSGSIVEEDKSVNISTDEVLKDECYTNSDYTDTYFSCYTCEYTTESNSDLSLHMETHTGPLPELKRVSTSTIENLIPEKSKRQYEKTYDQFSVWCRGKNVDKVSENILMAYLVEKSKTVKSSTLWSIYSMLKCMINIKEGINIRKFPKLVPFLKKKSVGYRATKSKVLTREEVNVFLTEASDENYLLWKVILIMGISGALRRDELSKMTVDDIQDVGSALIVQVPYAKIDKERTFIVTKPEFIKIYRKYAALRPTNAGNRRVFVRYQNGKCYNQVVGVHTFGKIPCLIAKYLGLPNSEAYTGHCYRRTSATLLADTGTDVSVLKYDSGGRSSTVEEVYVKNSIENKLEISNDSELSSSDAGVQHVDLPNENINCFI